ncbi:MAG: PAS domain S-box protein [Leptolyngbyaceae cyanobacterium CAN_BIN12]|nr:PAS domain S-box protein [Leptolyngbyaceae cyanobacterium CAN_BIN12]
MNEVSDSAEALGAVNSGLCQPELHPHNRYQQLMDALPQMMWVANADGAINYLNHAWTETLGVAIADSLEWRLFEYIHPDDRAIAFRQWQHSINTEQAFEVELRFREVDGAHRRFVVKGRPILDKANTVVEWVGTFTPASQARRVETELEQERELQTVITRNMAEGICLVRMSDRLIVYANPKFEQMFGYESSELNGQPVAILNYAPDLPAADGVAQAILQQVEQNGEATYTVHTIKKDGTLFWCEATTAVFEHPDHGTVVVAVQQDITDRLLAEQGLQEKERKFRAIFDQTFQFVGLLEPDGRLIEANQTALELGGVTAEQVVGRMFWQTPWWQVSHDIQVQLRQAIARAAAGELSRYEVEISGAGGSTVICDFSIKPLRDENGQVVLLISEGRDITQRKQAEAEVYKLNAELEDRVARRTAQMEQLNQMLAQTATLLEERNRELDQFAHIASHDLKAPLRSISNLAEWIEDDLQGQLPAENQQQLELLRKRVLRMEDLITGLLDYSRVGRTYAAIESVAISSLLEEVLDSLDPPAGFAIAIAPMPTLPARALLLRQVFANLIGNAIKHHDRPDGRITITASDQVDCYEFAVADDGPGIATDYHDRIFVIFQTLTARDSKENTGVGLSIVKKIVETEGGQIWVDSEVGQGTTFRFTWLKQPKDAIPEP